MFNLSMFAYLLAIVLCGLTAVLMTYKSIKKKDLSIVAGIITRVAFIYTGVLALTTNLTGQDELLYARIAIASVFFSDIVSNAVYLLSAKYQTKLEYRRLEKTLNDLSAKYKLILDTTPIGFYVIDKNGRLEYANPFALRLLGYKLADVINEPVFRFISPEYADKVKKMMKDKFNGIKIVDPYVVDLIHHDGHIVKVKVFSNLTVNGHPTITGNILTVEQCSG